MLNLVRAQVHLVTDRLQMVLGYVELNQCDKALPVVKQTVKEMRALAKLVASAQTMTAKTVGAVIDAPAGPLVHPAEAVPQQQQKRKYKARGPKMPGS